MDKGHLLILERDYIEVTNLKKRILIRLKLFYYFFTRYVWHSFLVRKMNKYIFPDSVVDKIDLYMKGDAGMFKVHTLGICNRFSTIRDSAVLVPGVGFGHNLYQLAARKPRLIVAFDLYEYPEEWAFLKKDIKEKFGVDVIFFNGDFPALPSKYKGFFDFAITDAVLEHVRDLTDFSKNIKDFLKDGAIFYASFGPLWYGPGGDHANYSDGNEFAHLVLPKSEYDRRVREELSEVKDDSCEAAFMIQEGLFSYLKAEEYFKVLNKEGFKFLRVYSKISYPSIKLFENDTVLFNKMNELELPAFDRFCSGFYFWLRVDKSK